jgi:hypothetical protein
MHAAQSGHCNHILVETCRAGTSSLAGPHSSTKPLTSMSWKKCPFGCVFEVRDPEWAIKARAPTVTCPTCHRASPPVRFTVAVAGQATQISNKAMATSLAVGGRRVDDLVKDRIRGLVQVSGVFESTRKTKIDGIYTRLVQLLMNAELNSNFKAKNIIGLLASGVMKNMWAWAVTDVKYAKERDTGEREVFGILSESIRESETPVAAERPVYITLNVGNLMQGGASMYGFSYFVYRDAVKLRSTFLATDSLQMLRGEARKPEAERIGVGVRDVATYASLPNVLLRVSDMRLKFLCHQAGGPLATYNDEFIEVHGWGEINLAEDVKAIVLSEVELQEFLSMDARRADGVPDAFKTLDLGARQRALAQLKVDLQTFCTQHKIELHFLNLNASTVRGTVARPRATV